MGGEALLQGGNGLCSTGLPWLVSLLAWSQWGSWGWEEKLPPMFSREAERRCWCVEATMAGCCRCWSLLEGEAGFCREVEGDEVWLLLGFLLRGGWVTRWRSWSWVRMRLKRKQGWLGNWKNGVEADFFTHFPPDFYSLQGIHLYFKGMKEGHMIFIFNKY